jgi:hypothetical protein
MADVPAVPARVRYWPDQGWRLWLADGLVAVVTCAIGTYVGLWFLPFIVGIGVGMRPVSRARWAAIPAMAGAVAGWAIPLWVLALRGLPIGATARTVAALAGLPPYAGVTVAATLLLAALQVLTGAWLARAVTSLRAARRGARPSPNGPQTAPDAAGDPQG